MFEIYLIRKTKKKEIILVFWHTNILITKVKLTKEEISFKSKMLSEIFAQNISFVSFFEINL